MRRSSACGRLHLGGEAVAAPRHRHDVAVLTLSLPERPAQRGDILREVVLLDEGVRPEGAHQLLLAEHLPGMPHEVDQRVEDPRRERHGLALPPQHPLAGVEAEVVELVDLWLLTAQYRFFRTFRTFL